MTEPSPIKKRADSKTPLRICVAVIAVLALLAGYLVLTARWRPTSFHGNNMSMSKLARRFDSPTAPIRTLLAGATADDREVTLERLLDSLPANPAISPAREGLVVFVKVDASASYQVYFDVVRDPPLLDGAKRNFAIFSSDTVTTSDGLEALEEDTMNTARTRARDILNAAIQEALAKAASATKPSGR